MSKHRAGLLANWGMASKLALGFSLVLALTALVAGIGLWSLGTIGKRFDGLQRMSEFNSELLALRQVEKDYALHGQAQEADTLRKGLDKLQASAEALRGQSPANEAPMQAVIAALKAYRQAFDEFVDINQSKDLALEMASWSVSSVANNLDVLQSGLADDGTWNLKQTKGEDGAQFIAQAGQVTQVSRLMLQAMEQARVRLEQARKGESDPAEGRIEQADQALQTAQALKAQIQDAGYQTVLDEVTNHIGAFTEKLAEYTDLLAKEKVVYRQLNDRATQAMGLVDKAYVEHYGAMQAELKKNAALIIASTVAALLVGLLAAWLITRLVVGPLRAVIARARAIAEGDLSANDAVERRDEIGQLMQAMQQMSQALARIVSGLQAGIVQLASNADSLSNVARQTHQEVTSAQAETEQVATAMHQMTATVHDVARNAEQAAQAAESADARVGSGQQVLRQSLQRIDRLAHSAESASTGIQSLSGEIQNIGQVLDVIKSVAEQTNLLALNAAIEAARAGEQGRGFAVVADEVRALAKRTQQSTEEIERLVSALRQAADASVVQIRSSGELVQQAVGDAQETAGALASIAEAVSTIQQMNQQIAAAAEEQSSVAEEINRSVVNIRGSADQSARAMEGNLGASQQLAELGAELKGMVSQFKL